MVHKLLIGANAGLWLPFALSRLRAHTRGNDGDGYFSERYVISGATIEIRQVGHEQYIRITEGGTGYFEFVTSGFPIVTYNASQEGIGDFGSYKGIVVGVDVQTSGGSLSFSPKIRGDKRSFDGTDVSIVGRSFQAQLINEPVGYFNPEQQKKRTIWPNALYESWAPGNPHTGVLLRGTDFCQGTSIRGYPGSLTNEILRDVGFDVPWVVGTGSDKLKRAQLQLPADWARASGIQKVVDQTNGTRTFAIFVDAFNQINVFPTSAIGPVDPEHHNAQNVDAALVKQATYTLPAWCYKPATKLRTQFAADPTGFAQHGVVDTPEIDWKFNPLGTKMAAVIYERRPFEHDGTYWNSNIGEDRFNPGSPNPEVFTEANFNDLADRLGPQHRIDQWFYPEASPQRYFCGPGVVEITITIGLDGPGDDQFTVNAAVRQVRIPSETLFCTLATGYALYDIKSDVKDAPNIVSAGDLIVFDLERWAFRSGSVLDINPSVCPGGSKHWLLVWRNLTTNTEIKNYLATDRKVVAIDVPTLSFVVTTYWEPRPEGPSWNTMAAVVYTQTKFREQLYPLVEPAEHIKQGMLLESQVDGRLFIAALPIHPEFCVGTLPPAYLYVPFNHTVGGVIKEGAYATGDPSAARVREVFARGRNSYGFWLASQTGDTSQRRFYDFDDGGQYFKTSDDPFGESLAGHEAFLENIDGRWVPFPTQFLFRGDHPFFTPAPMWGWNMYASDIADYFQPLPDALFYIHPNGSWAFWCNSFLATLLYESFEALAGALTQIQHVIFDRVHIELTTKEGNKAKGNTTFFDLYNKAVGKMDSEVARTEKIETMKPANLRATFALHPVIFTGVDPSHIALTAELEAIWDGGHWFRPDPGIVSENPALAYSIDTPYIGALLAPSFSTYWYTATNYSGAQQIPALQKMHVRFANCLLLSA